MENQKKLIEEANWDNLIILDACRFDFFKELIAFLPNFTGDLSKVRSSGRVTDEFLANTFDSRYNYEVFSAHPKVNSKGDPSDDKYGYVASEHFMRIHDLWKSEWDGTIDTVSPDSVNEYFLNDFDKNEDKFEGRIFWYLQPHTPHIGIFSISAGGSLVRGDYGDDILPDGIDPDSLTNLIRLSYYFNLFHVLYSVAELIPLLEGKTVVTSDHGELLKSEEFGHFDDREREKLREVPWLEIQGSAKDIRNCTGEEAVNVAYENMLNRSPSEEAVEFKIDSLERGSVNRRDIYKRIILSEEFRQKFGPYLEMIDN